MCNFNATLLYKIQVNPQLPEDIPYRNIGLRITVPYGYNKTNSLVSLTQDNYLRESELPYCLQLYLKFYILHWLCRPGAPTLSFPICTKSLHSRHCNSVRINFLLLFLIFPTVCRLAKELNYYTFCLLSKKSSEQNNL